MLQKRFHNKTQSSFYRQQGGPKRKNTSHFKDNFSVCKIYCWANRYWKIHSVVGFYTQKLHLQTGMFQAAGRVLAFCIGACTQYGAEIKSGNLFVHWPTIQPTSFQQICYVTKVWKNRNPSLKFVTFSQSCNLSLNMYLHIWHRPTGKVGCWSLQWWQLKWSPCKLKWEPSPHRMFHIFARADSMIPEIAFDLGSLAR